MRTMTRKTDNERNMKTLWSGGTYAMPSPHPFKVCERGDEGYEERTYKNHEKDEDRMKMREGNYTQECGFILTDGKHDMRRH